MKQIDERYKHNYTFSYFMIKEWDGKWFMRGVHHSNHGYVLIYHQYDGLVRLDFFYNGYDHYRTIRGKVRTERGLAILAGRFAREVVSKYSKP